MEWYYKPIMPLCQLNLVSQKTIAYSPSNLQAQRDGYRIGKPHKSLLGFSRPFDIDG